MNAPLRFIISRDAPEQDQWVAELRLNSDMIGFTTWIAEVCRDVGSGAAVDWLGWYTSSGCLYLGVWLKNNVERWEHRYQVLGRGDWHVRGPLGRVYVHHLETFQRLAQEILDYKIAWVWGCCEACSSSEGKRPSALARVKDGLCSECHERKEQDRLPSGINGTYVYFVADGDAVKIGKSVDPDVRITELQIGNSRKLALLAILPGSEELERHLHRRFRDYHRRGEWFDRETVMRWLKKKYEEGVAVEWRTGPENGSTDPSPNGKSGKGDSSSHG